MMLAGADLRVVPLTIHIPLCRSSGALITKTAIVETGRIVLDALRNDFGLQHPRLAVAGLNPHAGEDGEIGHEEQEIIRAGRSRTARVRPHRAWARCRPTRCSTKKRAPHYDAALCMYHDQALIPLKTLAFWDGVNVTLGLPIVRTSPDHGTALDIAGTRQSRFRAA